MKYLRVKWNHNTNPDEPVWLFSEIDDAGCELRKMECFQNGFCDYATTKESTGNAALTTHPVPDPAVPAHDPEFQPVEISPEEFEKIWRKRRYP